MSSAVIGSLLAVAAGGAWGLSDFLAGVRTRTTALPVVLLLSQFAGLIALTAAVAASSSDRSALVLPGASMIPAAAAGAAGAARSACSTQPWPAPGSRWWRRSRREQRPYRSRSGCCAARR
jgi:hypothetical protein